VLVLLLDGLQVHEQQQLDSEYQQQRDGSEGSRTPRGTAAAAAAA